MGKYIVKRLLWMIPIVLGVAVLVFTLMLFCPGNPAEIILGGTATEAEIAAKTEELGLNDPYLVRLGTYLSDVFLHGDLGASWSTNVDIMSTILERLPRTMILTIVTLFIAYGLGVPLGIIAATHQNRWQDTASMLVALVGLAIPNFWLAMMMMLFFSLQLGILPASGVEDGWRSYVMPVIALSLPPMAEVIRMTRSAMLETIRQDYIRTARAKGLSEKKVIYHHAFRNTLIPLVTIVGGSLPGLFSGALITETLFSIPGIGFTSYTAMTAGDIPFSMFYMTFLAVLTLLGNLISDILYAVVDPRVRIA